MNNDERTLPVSPRTIESVIRISAAIAKARLSKAVESRDVTAAAEILRESNLKK